MKQGGTVLAGMSNSLWLLPLSTMNVVAVFMAQLVVLARIGPGSATDAFLAAAAVPQMLVGMASAAMSSVLVPLLSGEPRQRQNADAWFLLSVIGGILGTVALLMSWFAESWTPWIFPGFSGDDATLCASLARVQIFSMVFGAANSVVAAVCYARGQFILVEIATFLAAIASVGLLYISLPEFGIVAAAWIFTLAACFQMLILMPVLGWPRRFDGSAQTASHAWSRIKPVLAGNVYNKSDILVDRYLLSMANAGEMTLFGLAQQFHVALAGIFGKVWGNTAIPGLAIFAKQGDRQQFFGLYRRRLILLGLVTASAYLLLLAGRPMMTLVLGQGKVAVDDILVLWWLMVYLGGVLVFGSFGTILSGAFYAMGDTKTPTVIGMATFTLFVLVKIFAFRSFGAMGVALAASGYYALNAFLLAGALPWLSRRKMVSHGSG